MRLRTMFPIFWRALVLTFALLASSCSSKPPEHGTLFVVSLETNSTLRINDLPGAITRTEEAFRKRFRTAGVRAYVEHNAAGQVLIQLPPQSTNDLRLSRQVIARNGFLEFRLVHPDSDTLVKRGWLAVGYTNLALEAKDLNGDESVYQYLVERKPVPSSDGRELTGKVVTSAKVFVDPLSGQPKISVTFNAEGAEMFGDITRRNVGKSLAIIVDGKLYAAPVIRTEILGGQCEISGGFAITEAAELASALSAPLECPISIVEERDF